MKPTKLQTGRPAKARKAGRVMWATQPIDSYLQLLSEKSGCFRIPVLVLPLDDLDGLTERVAHALHGGSWTFDIGLDSSRECYFDNARAVLRALGVPDARRGRK